ncbi:MAG TPA: hypothetical protein VMD03_10435 [Steroidobacteraceae bacterium]|nr:hypothetical protein [Steroidobacteraceae bacterium]
MRKRGAGWARRQAHKFAEFYRRNPPRSPNERSQAIGWKPFVYNLSLAMIGGRITSWDHKRNPAAPRQAGFCCVALSAWTVVGGAAFHEFCAKDFSAKSHLMMGGVNVVVIDLSVGVKNSSSVDDFVNLFLRNGISVGHEMRRPSGLHNVLADFGGNSAIDRSEFLGRRQAIQDDNVNNIECGGATKVLDVYCEPKLIGRGQDRFVEGLDANSRAADYLGLGNLAFVSLEGSSANDQEPSRKDGVQPDAESRQNIPKMAALFAGAICFCVGVLLLSEGLQFPRYRFSYVIISWPLGVIGFVLILFGILR